MADITVNWHVELPGGGPPLAGAVKIDLVSSTGEGFLAGLEVLGTQWLSLDTGGNASITLTPNIGAGAITLPTDTYYRVTEFASGQQFSRYYIRVDGSGTNPVDVSNILYTP